MYTVRYSYNILCNAALTGVPEPKYAAKYSLLAFFPSSTKSCFSLSNLTAHWIYFDELQINQLVE